ncbi:unnamed protein product [Cunninghamella blakesleeana]
MVEPIIIDTDPGIDDALAIILAYLSPEIQIKAITLTHGNVGIDCVKKNAVTILNVMEEQRKYMKLPSKELPVLAIGADGPLAIEPVVATYFHHKDGLGGIYDKLHDAPKDWEKHLIHGNEGITNKEERWFETTERDGADEILYQLKQTDPLTLTIVAIGPLTNIALAYQRDPITFSRAKRVIIMGGNYNTPGNTVPYAEFNFRADPHAADIVMSTSQGFKHTPEGYQQRLSLIENKKVAPMHIVVLPLDGSDDGTISKDNYEKYILPLGKSTPLYSFINAFMIWSFDVCLDLFKLDNWAVYDAYTVLLMIEMISDKGDGINQDTTFNDRWEYEYADMVIETTGTRTLGMCCTDKRAWAPIDTSSWGPKRNNVQVFLKGDGLRFRKILLNTIFDAKIKL